MSFRLTAGLSAVLAMALAAGSPAAARTRVFIGLGVFPPAPFFYAPGPVYYYAPPPPVYYYPPPAPAYAYPPPPPAYYPPAAAYASPAAPQQTANCREFKGDATIDGSRQPFYGTACLQADGKWHIIR